MKRVIVVMIAVFVTLAAGQNALKIAIPGAIDRMHPLLSANGADLTVMQNIYDTLLWLDVETGELVPRLATEWEAVDESTWRFVLRPGVRFHNGEPVNAEAVKYSIESILEAGNVSSHQPRIVQIESVEVVDDLTVLIHTDGPFPELPYRMQPVGGTGRVYIVPPAYFSEHGDDIGYIEDHPVGSGPYRLVELRRGQYAELEVNEDYWGPKPDFDSVTFYFIPETATRVAALLSGEVDLIEALPVDDVARVEATANKQVIEDPNGLVVTLIANPGVKPLDDIRVREAVALSIDFDLIIEELLAGRGRVIPVMLPPELADFNSDLTPYPYDPERAKQLLEEAGYGGGIEWTTFMSDGRYVADRSIYEVINAQLSEVGIETNASVVEWGRALDMMAQGNFGPFYMIGWDFGEGVASKMDTLFLSTARQARFHLDEYDRLSRAGNIELDAAKRAQYWREAQKVVYDNYSLLGTWQTSALYGAADWISWSRPYGNIIQVQDIRLAR